MMGKILDIPSTDPCHHSLDSKAMLATVTMVDRQGKIST